MNWNVMRTFALQCNCLPIRYVSVKLSQCIKNLGSLGLHFDSWTSQSW